MECHRNIPETQFRRGIAPTPRDSDRRPIRIDMSVYRIAPEAFEPLRETSFEAERFFERSGMQPMLRDRPDVLEEGLFILAEEYGDWEESNRRIDLLALDKEGRLVVIELKRSDQDSLMDLQAIRYASMVANMTLEQAIDAHRVYLSKRGIEEDAESRIREHLSSDDAEIRIDTGKPRIILVSSNFSKELTTSVLWLKGFKLDITCVKLQPYRSGEELFLERSLFIPIPETEDYLVRWRDREREVERQETSQVETTSGADAFRGAIEAANPNSKEMLEQLYGWALSLESNNLAWLSTRSGSYNNVLRVTLPGSNSGLVNILKNKLGWGYLKFNGNLLDSRAPRSKERIEKIIDITIGQNSTLWELKEGFLEALTDAYREANGVVSAVVEEESVSREETTWS